MRVGLLVGWCPMVVRFVCVTRVPVCACVSRVCPGSPGVLLPTFYRHELRVSCLVLTKVLTRHTRLQVLACYRVRHSYCPL